MSFDLILLATLYTFPAIAFVIILLQRLSHRIRGRGFYPSTAAIGNALHQLQSIAEPGIQHVVTETLTEEAEEDDTGDPIKHLHRQANQIRRGKPPDRLTTYLERQNCVRPPGTKV